jgi:hypothetical protein
MVEMVCAEDFNESTGMVIAFAKTKAQLSGENFRGRFQRLKTLLFTEKRIISSLIDQHQVRIGPPVHHRPWVPRRPCFPIPLEIFREYFRSRGCFGSIADWGKV